MEIYRLIFVDILIPIVTLVLGFLGGKMYQIKIIKKQNENKINILSGNNSTIGNNNESIQRDKMTISGENNSNIIAIGENSQAAGRDIINGKQQN